MDEHQRESDVLLRFPVKAVMIIAALALLIAFFLPWASATALFREAAGTSPDEVLYEQTGTTVSDAVELSLFDFAQLYAAESSELIIDSVIMCAMLIASIIVLILASRDKPIGAAIIALLTFAGSRLLVWDFEARGVIPSTYYDWGFAPTIYIVATVLLLAAAIWRAALKRKAKA